MIRPTLRRILLILTSILASSVFSLLHNYNDLNLKLYWLIFPSRGERLLEIANQTAKQKVILFTTKWWSPTFPYLKEASAFCPKCLFTQNASMWDRSDGIVFHGRMLNQTVPQRTNSKQIWVMMQFETFLNDEKQDKNVFPFMKLYDGLFNWTMTYRRDSDVFVPYGKFIPIKKTPRPRNTREGWAFTDGARLNETYDNYKYVVTPSLKNFKNRKMAAWITSRCVSSSRREDKIAALSKYMKIDIYGSNACAKKQCYVPKWKAKTGIDCRLQIHKNYKFYFAFENSLCEDYVTEKFFDTATMEMIPVVYGGADYRAMFPAKSFINLKDFKNIKALAGYMKYLSDNPNEWLKYFEWRKKYWIQTNRFITGYCSLCDKLWSNYSQQSYKSVADWWMYGSSEGHKNNPVCHLPSTGLTLKLVPYFSEKKKLHTKKGKG